MKILFLICSLFFSHTVISQSADSYYCTFRQINNEAELIRIQLLVPALTNGTQSHFSNFTGDRISYTNVLEDGRTCQINYLDIYKSKRGGILTSLNCVSQLELQPNTNHYTFVLRGTEDALILKKGNKYTEIWKTNKILHYTWLNEFDVAIIGVDDTGRKTCYLYNITTKTKTDISIHPGSSLARLTNDELAFVDIFSDAYRYIKVYDFSKKTSRIITKIPADVTSFAVRDQDSYFITQGNKILRYVAGTDVSWKTFYSFEAYGMNKLTEIYSIKHNHFIIKNEN